MLSVTGTLSNDKTHNADIGSAKVMLCAVIFTVIDECLHTVLIRNAHESEAWAVPFADLQSGHHLDEQAKNMVQARTNLDDCYLEQLYTFVSKDAHDKDASVTVAYLGLVPPQGVGSRYKGYQKKKVDWHASDALPGLCSGDEEMVNNALARLQAKLSYSTIVFQLMPEEFTLGEVQRTYEAILGQALDKRNFRKRINSWNCIEQTERFHRAGSHRPARVYRYYGVGGIQYIK